MADSESTVIYEKPPEWKAYLALVVLIIFFSGIGRVLGPAVAWLDFTLLVGKFGIITEGLSFLGKGGEGVRFAFLYGLSVIPCIMLALGVVEVATRYGALYAAQRLLNPLLQPLIGVRGSSGVALITSLQSSDAGAAMTRELVDQGFLDNRERAICCAFEYSSGASIVAYLTIASSLFPYLEIHYLAPLGVILLCKLFGANLMRLYVRKRQGGLS